MIILICTLAALITFGVGMMFGIWYQGRKQRHTEAATSAKEKQ